MTTDGDTAISLLRDLVTVGAVMYYGPSESEIFLDSDGAVALTPAQADLLRRLHQERHQ